MSFLKSYVRPAMKRRLIAGIIPEWLQRHKRRDYIVSAVLSCPYWVDRKELNKLMNEARRLTLATGVPHEVNHIIPIRHPLVSGLTVPWNLEVITQHRNGRLGNCFDLRDPHQQHELFERAQSEQYQLSL